MEDLKRNKKRLKTNLTKFLNYVVELADDADMDELEFRYKAQLKHQEEFRTIINNMLNLCSDDDECNALAEEEELYNDNHRIACVKSIKLLRKTTASRATSEAPSASIQKAQLKLPALELPTFTGAIDEWQGFMNSFESLIHNNDDIPAIQKFHYLKGSIKGDASFVIQKISITENNYSLAWKTLKEHYQDKRVITKTLLDQLFNLPIVQTDNFTSMRSYVFEFTRTLGCLEMLNEPTIDSILIYLCVSKLDRLSKGEWEQYCLTLDMELPKQADLLTFLNNRVRILSARDMHSSAEHNRRQSKRVSNMAISPTCMFCNGNHRIYKCETYANLDINQKWQFVRNKALCVACLGNSVRHQNCRYKCFKCGKRHHISLHRNTVKEFIKDTETTPGTSGSTMQQDSMPSHTNHPIELNASRTVNTFFTESEGCEALLQTVLVHVLDKDGNTHTARALLDNGSQLNLMSQGFANRLNTGTVQANATIYGVGNAPITAQGKTRMSIRSMHTNYNKELEFVILDRLSTTIPNKRLNKDKFNIPMHLPLADPEFYIPGKIDLIIGAAIFWDLTCIGQIQLQPGIVMQKTKLGWIISGAIPSALNDQNKQAYHVHTVAENSDGCLDKMVKQFWELETVSEPPSFAPSPCEISFRKGTSRDDSGRFIVELPFNDNQHTLGSNYEQARARFKSMERKFARNVNLKQQYTEFMEEYIALGHMTVHCDAPTIGYYLPHHAVFKETSATTRCRVVFDGSCNSTNGVSLNDTLHTGPVVQDDLVSILLRFRKYAVVLTGDIEKMYRQVLIHEKHRDYQKILWRAATDDVVKSYKLNTVTYGTSCAPYLATRCLIELANVEDRDFPIASQVLKNDFYVDDCITGCDTISAARNLKRELIGLLNQGRFKLHKWRSNIAEFVDNGANKTVKLNKSDMNTLGLLWNYQEDTLSYLAPRSFARKITKRVILSETAQLFDPLGLVGPIIVAAKLLLQQLWKDNFDWDEAVPMGIHSAWTRYREELPEINNLSLPRRITTLHYVKVQLHAFCESSEKAYGAVLYIRTSDVADNVQVQLLCSKSRVCPLKPTTMPRLELTAALLASRLVKRVVGSLHIDFNAVYYWTDSTIVLSWLKTPPEQWKTFVANRVCEIQADTVGAHWRHVRSGDNPADIISRGASPVQLSEGQLWWEGPPFLQQPPMQWPVLPDTCDEFESQEQRRTNKVFVTNVNNAEFTLRYSSLTKLRRVTAYCLRFLYNVRHTEPMVGPLSAAELDAASIALLRQQQTAAFSSEVRLLQRGEPLPRRSHMIRLRPFLDDKGLMRVGGRLHNAELPYEHRHPIILPKSNHLTDLIINFEHIRHCHAGATAVLAALRTKYWPLSGLMTVKRVLRQCVRCSRDHPTPIVPLMGSLPATRVRPARPFSICGLDYCGPFHLRFNHRRGARSIKAYIAVFVCFTTKAVHLELVGDMTTAACLSAIRRFTARRGLPAHIYSDNGTNFVGVNNELKRLARLFNSAPNQEHLACHGIEWHFLPPRSPHLGGLWEAAVKIAKRHLRRVCSSALLTYEEMTTILAQVEACLNSRPITPLSDDPADLEALTPGHFLIGDLLTAVPDVDLTDTQVNRLSHWQRTQQITQHFWQRWQREYLTQQQQRTKWFKESEPLKLGALVTIRNDSLPPLQWRMGRVVQLHPGGDGISRIASVKTSASVVKCAVAKLCLLPIKFDGN